MPSPSPERLGPGVQVNPGSRVRAVPVLGTLARCSSVVRRPWPGSRGWSPVPARAVVVHCCYAVSREAARRRFSALQLKTQMA